MKKTLFAILAALFAISMIATCDLFEPPSGVSAARDDTPQFAPDGRPLVRVTIDFGDSGAAGISRALTLAQAQSNVNSYEVAFCDSSGTSFYRASWNIGTTGTISVPVDDYPSASRAVLFAGTNQTLLAVGSLTKVNGADGNSIDMTTTSVTFTLVALKSEVNSSFSILGPISPVSPFSTESTYAGRPTGTIATYTFPTFPVPGPAYPNTGTPTAATHIVAQYKIECGTSGTNYAGVKIKEAWTGNASAPETGELGGYAGVEGTVSIILMDPSAGNVVPTDGKFTFNINASGVTKDGYSKIFINVPVVALSNITTPNHGSPGTWHIKGGLDNDLLDGTSSPASTSGGAVMLQVGTPQAFVEGIIVDPGTGIDENG